MRFGVLGPLDVREDGQNIRIQGQKLRTLLAVLLVHADEVVPAYLLAGILRPSAASHEARHALHSQISRLRAVIDRPGPGRRRRLVRLGPGYQLRLGQDELDAFAFEELSRRSRRALADRDWRTAAAVAETALALWRGAALGEFADMEFAQARAAHLEEERLLALECRIDARLALGEHRALVGELEGLVARHRFRESLWGGLMVALYRSGRQSDALRAFERARRLLAEELGISPGVELARLNQAVLDQDPALAAPSEAPLPTQTRRPVTFLFTEVEHGTTPWDKDPADLSAAVRTHDVIVQNEVGRHAGCVIAQSGEGLWAAFDRAPDAVKAALGIQRRLVAGSAADDHQLRVKAAVHTGDAELRDGSYIGPAVSHTARLRDAAHAGQVLVSAATRILTGPEAPDMEAELVQIGRWQFDDSSYSESVYQLHHPDLPTGFPPLRSANQHTGGLPKSATSFIGRRADVERAVDALQGNPVVTISGEGGVGKTRLAIEAAARADRAVYPDGVWFCDLSGVQSSDHLVEVIASTLQLTTTIGTNVRAALKAFLHGTRLLLVLDNCEQIRPAVAELVDDIVATGSEITILATSRAPLRARAEQVVDLEPLAPSVTSATRIAAAPAVQLLLDRARTAGAPVREDDPALVDIAALLDGVPLAIELAAPHLASMSPAELAGRLDRGLELLIAPSTVPARQRTVRATIDWSFNLLSPAAQRLFGALSVFRGGWTLETAELVASAVDVDERAAAPLITELVEHSMIRVQLPATGATRYRMLETVRAYAAEHLAQMGRAAEVATRHAQHFIALAETAARHRRGPLEPAWVREIEAEFDNMRVAYRWAVDTDRPAEGLRLIAALVEDVTRDRLELGRWAEELAALPTATAEPLRPIALGLAGHTAMLEYRLEDALRLSLEALEVERALSSSPSWLPRTNLALLTGLGFVEGDAREHLAAMDEISRMTHDPYAAAVADFDRVMILTLIGRPEKGLRAAERVLGVGIETRNPSLLAMGLLSHGRAVAAADPDQAALDFQDARRAASSAHNTLLVHHAVRALQELKARSGNRAEVLTSLRQLAAKFERSGHVTEQYHTVISMLDSFVALEAWSLLATICGALSQTPWRYTASASMLEATVAQALDRSNYIAARRAGAAMSVSDLVAAVSGFIRGLPDGGSVDGRATVVFAQ